VERRCFLQAGLVLGATYVGEQFDLVPAEAARPLKLKRHFFEGGLSTEDGAFSNRLRMAIVGKRVIGFGSPFPSGQDTQPHIQLNGHVRNGKLKGSLTLAFDPLHRAELGTVVGKVSAHVGKKSVKGKLVSTGIPGTTPDAVGLLFADILEEDVDAMRQVAGVYDGAVTSGLPNFSAVATLGANGTYTLESIQHADGTPVPGRIGGVYMLGKPFNPGQFDRLIYSLPLPASSNGAQVEGGGLGIFDCDCCEKSEQEKEKKEEAQQAADAAIAKVMADEALKNLHLNNGGSNDRFSFVVQGVKR
jgi:hypothetical protein